MTAKSKILSVVVCLLVGLLITVAIVYQPRVVIHHEQELVGPDEPVMVLLGEDRPLEEIKKAVEKSGKGVDEISWRNGSLLHWAADHKRADVAEWLLSKGANPNGTSPSMTPLQAAVSREDVVMVKLLIKAGADPDLAASEVTPRVIAKANGFTEIIAALPPKKPAHDKQK